MQEHTIDGPHHGYGRVLWTGTAGVQPHGPIWKVQVALPSVESFLTYTIEHTLSLCCCVASWERVGPCIVSIYMKMRDPHRVYHGKLRCTKWGGGWRTMAQAHPKERRCMRTILLLVIFAWALSLNHKEPHLLWKPPSVHLVGGIKARSNWNRPSRPAESPKSLLNFEKGNTPICFKCWTIALYIYSLVLRKTPN